MHMGSMLKTKPGADLWNSSVEIQIHFVYCSAELEVLIMVFYYDQILTKVFMKTL